VDGTDFGIVAHLFQDPLAGPQAIARGLGLTRNAVARRLRALAVGPPWLRVHALPHPGLLGRASTVNLFATKGAVDGPALLACPDVIAYDLNHDGLCAVTLWSRTTPALATVRRLLGAPPVAVFDADVPALAPYLPRLDWKVLVALVRDPRATAAGLARATGLAARTCSRARNRLLAAGAVRVAVGLQEDRAGLPVFRAYVQGHPDEARVRAVLGGDAVVTDVVAQGRVWFSRAPTVGGIVTAVQALRGLPGVEDVKLILSRDVGVATDRIVGWCLEAGGLPPEPV